MWTTKILEADRCSSATESSTSVRCSTPMAASPTTPTPRSTSCRPSSTHSLRTPPTTPTCASADQGIKRKRWYVEGYERFDTDGQLVRCDPKGIEIRTRIHPSIDATVSAVQKDVARLDDALATSQLRSTVIAFNPVRSEYVIEPPLNEWERRHRLGSPEERTAHLHMSTYGPDLNLSCAALDATALVDVGRKLTYYSPWLVPLSFSSPFRDGAPWGGLSARTAIRTGLRPAVLVFLGDGDEQVEADPSLTQLARLPAEVGRIEFKAFDACPDLELYGELLSWLTGLVLRRDAARAPHHAGRRAPPARRGGRAGRRRRARRHGSASRRGSSGARRPRRRPGPARAVAGALGGPRKPRRRDARPVRGRRARRRPAPSRRLSRSHLT